MFQFAPESVRDAAVATTNELMALNKRMVEFQVGQMKQAEKGMLSAFEATRASLEATTKLVEAQQKAFLDAMTKKAEA
jgi:hypothetical protein